MPPGKVVHLNGPSSSGKTTLALRLQAILSEPFWQYSIDLFRDARVLPWERIERGDFRWRELRPQFHEGFLRSIAAFAHSGNNLIVDYIVETPASRDRLVELLNGLDVFFVGVHCALPELERREIARGDRRVGEARVDFETTHSLCTYDVEVDSTAGAVDQMAQSVLRAWTERRSPAAFDRMRLAR
jgi:chloramphenicol 3-O phosphotransferase